MNYLYQFSNFLFSPPTMEANVKVHHDRDTGESPPSKSVRTLVEPDGEENQSQFLQDLKHILKSHLSGACLGPGLVPVLDKAPGPIGPYSPL